MSWKQIGIPRYFIATFQSPLSFLINSFITKKSNKRKTEKCKLILNTYTCVYTKGAITMWLPVILIFSSWLFSMYIIYRSSFTLFVFYSFINHPIIIHRLNSYTLIQHSTYTLFALLSATISENSSRRWRNTAIFCDNSFFLIKQRKTLILIDWQSFDLFEHHIKMPINICYVGDIMLQNVHEHTLWLNSSVSLNEDIPIFFHIVMLFT